MPLREALQDNHRGITITPLISKIIELIIRGPEYEINCLLPQNKLQFGFTPDESPEMAIVCINEAITEAEVEDLDLHTASLDAKKAFDLVLQTLMKRKLFHSKLPLQTWAIIDSMYSDNKESFKLNGRFSESYTILRGVKQGSILSPIIYKNYIYDLLYCLRKDSIGLKIGTLYFGTPTVADDVFLMSNASPELQAMLDFCFSYAMEHGYSLNIIKSLACPLRKRRSPNPESTPSCTYLLGENELPTKSTFVHLGLEWKAGGKYPDISKKISSARRAAYALFGSGLHGINGLGLSAAFNLVQTFIVPILLYGLNAVTLPNCEIEKLEKFFKDILRQLQGLPSSSANIAVYLLAGTIPLEGLLHKRVLGLFGQIARLNEEHPLRILALRQLSLRDRKSGSWFAYTYLIAKKYDLNILQILNNPMKKQDWKNYCDKTIDQHWRSTMIRKTTEMNSLKFLLPSSFFPLKTHGLWSACKGNPRLVKKATIRAKMLIRRYTCGASPWRKLRCPVCDHEKEDIIHILSSCPKLYSKQILKYKEELKAFFIEENLPPPNSDEELGSAILNGDSFIKETSIIQLKKRQKEAHTVASLICYDIHVQRDLLMSEAALDPDLDATIPYAYGEDCI